MVPPRPLTRGKRPRASASAPQTRQAFCARPPHPSSRQQGGHARWEAYVLEEKGRPVLAGHTISIFSPPPGKTPGDFIFPTPGLGAQPLACGHGSHVRVRRPSRAGDALHGAAEAARPSAVVVRGPRTAAAPGDGRPIDRRPRRLALCARCSRRLGRSRCQGAPRPQDRPPAGPLCPRRRRFGPRAAETQRRRRSVRRCTHRYAPPPYTPGNAPDPPQNGSRLTCSRRIQQHMAAATAQRPA